MSWTETTRRQYGRSGLRYASDLTDGEWALLRPLMPPTRGLAAVREGLAGCDERDSLHGFDGFPVAAVPRPGSRAMASATTLREYLGSESLGS